MQTKKVAKKKIASGTNTRYESKICDGPILKGGTKSCDVRGFCTPAEWAYENNCYSKVISNNYRNKCLCANGVYCEQDWTKSGQKTNCPCGCKFLYHQTKPCDLKTSSGSCVPGLNMLASGYDVTKIGDFEMVKSHIWDLAQMEGMNVVMKDHSNCELYVSPKHATVTILAEPAIKEDSVVVETKQEYAEHLCNTYSVDEAFDAVDSKLPSVVKCESYPMSNTCQLQLKDTIKDKVKSAIGGNGEFSFSIDKAQRVQKSLASTSLVVTTHRVATKKNTPFDPKFLARVNALPASYDKDIYQGFIEDYGTHFTTSADLGGSIEYTAFAAKCTSSETRSNTIKAEIGVEFGRKIGPVSIGMETKFETTDTFSKSLSRKRWMTKGGTGLTFAKPKFVFGTWVKEVRSNPWPVNLDLHSIAFLMTDEIRSENMQLALSAYLNESKKKIEKPISESFKDPLTCPSEPSLTTTAWHSNSIVCRILWITVLFRMLQI